MSTSPKIVEVLDPVVEPTYHLILWNDDHTLFDWVIQCLVEVLQHDPIQAQQCAFIVHFKGKCSVKRAELERLKAYQTCLTERKLIVTIEQTP